MFIEDEELRYLYRDASQEHLDNLEAGLLRLEKTPGDHSPLKALLREAHSLKGDSRMLGVGTAETLTHHVEDLLIAVDQGQVEVTAEVCDRLYKGLDAIRKVAHEAITNEPANIDLAAMLAQISGDDIDPANNSILAEDTPPESDALAMMSDTLPTDPEGSAIFPSIEDGNLDADPTTTAEDIDFSTPHIPAGLDLSKLDPELVAALTGTAPPAPSPIEPDLEPPAPLPAFLEAEPLFDVPIADIPIVDAPLPDLVPVAASTPVSPQAAEPLPAPVPPADDPPAMRTHDERYHIDTVRVGADKLDTLMNQAGELAVTKSRIARRLDDITQLLNLWESWSREAYVNRAILDQCLNHLPTESGNELQAFYHHNQNRLEQLGSQIHQLRNIAYEDTARLESVAHKLEGDILKLRRLPLSTLFNLFPRMVRDIAKQEGKQVNLVIEGGDTLADKRILEEMKAPLTHLLRNAIDHGIESPSERLAADKPLTATITLRGYQSGGRIGIELSDDGQGLNLGKIKRTAIRRQLHTQTELDRMSAQQIQSLIFAPGFSTRSTVSELSGRGVGLDVVRANVERLKGTIDVMSAEGQGCLFKFSLRTSLTTTDALIITAQGSTFALPAEFVDRMTWVKQESVFAIEGSPTITYQEQPLSVVWLADLLELPGQAPNTVMGLSSHQSLICVVLKVGNERLGLLVDGLQEQQEIVLKPQSKLLQRVRNITGATILGNGEVCMVLNPHDLLRSAQGGNINAATEERLEQSSWQPKVLLVEDSLPIRTQVRRILQGAGYAVTAAVDGLDGYQKLENDCFDAVVSDVEMPNLDGLSLTSRIREQDKYEDLPIILVTTLAKDEDKQRGADAGANAYLTKGDFDQSLLLNTLRRLI